MVGALAEGSDVEALSSAVANVTSLLEKHTKIPIDQVCLLRRYYYHYI